MNHSHFLFFNQLDTGPAIHIATQVGLRHAQDAGEALKARATGESGAPGAKAAGIDEISIR